MKTAKLILAVLCAAICICVLTVVASAAYPYGDAIYVSATGADSGSGSSADAPVNFVRAQTLVNAYTWEGTLTVYINGTVSASALGGKSHVTYRGVAGTTPTINIAASCRANGDIAFEDLKVNTAGNTDVNIYTMGHNVEVGAGVTGFIGTISTGDLYASGDLKNITKSMDEPWEVTIRSGGSADSPVVKRYALARGAQTFTGHAILNLEDGSAIDMIHRNAGAVTYYGIEEVNIKNGSTLNYFFNEHAGGSTTQHGLRYIRFDTPNIPDSRFFLYGSNSAQANTGDTGVIVFEIGPNANAAALTAYSGIANESELTHVFIYNNNDAAKVANKWFPNFPNRYGFQVDGTGTVSAYMSTLPTAENGYDCVFGGIVFDTTYTHAILDEGTDNEAVIEIASLTNNQYPVANIAQNSVHTVTFRNVTASDPVVFDNTASTSAAGYIADTRDAADKTFAIIASFKMDTFDATEIESFGAYFFDADNDEASIIAVDPTGLDSADGRFYIVIYGIGTIDTSVAVKPFATVAGTAYYGTVLDVVPSVVGADTYYGPETAVVGYFN